MKSKILFSGIVAIPITFIVDVLSYVYTDWEFAKWICTLVLLDTLLGIVKAIIHKNVSSDEFGNRFCKKMIAYLSLLILSNALFSAKIQGSSVGITQWLSEYLCVIILVREAISILENVNAIAPIVPSWILKYLKDFNDKGEYNKPNGNIQDSSK